MNDVNKDFWDIVGTRADPSELEVGDLFRLEFGSRRTVKVVAEKWIDGRGLTQLRIEDAPPRDYTGIPLMTVVVPT
jgi:hypothetical protein